MGSNGTSVESINGEMLLDLGRRLNKPMLTLVGMAIKNIKINPCDEWSQWSECGKLKVGYVAVNKRTSGKDGSGDTTTETDIRICERNCPKDYNITKNGLCVKLYVVRKTFDLAEKQCQKDGGHVINLDSKLKNDDLKNFLKGYSTVLQGFSSYIDIDGRRKDSSSAWLTINGSQKTFFNWRSGEPDNGICIAMLYTDSLWEDLTVCTISRPFVCEIKH